ncbi:MAG: AmmeMemoRadiSam system protein B [Bacteroidota bacterium]
MEILDSSIYATQPLPLQKQLKTLLSESSQYPVEDEILGIIVPDSNLLSGGPVAANVFKTIAGKSYDTVVIVSSSHTGPFKRMTICNLNSYRTPLGDVPINEKVCHELCDEDDDIYLDDQGHFHNKGIDVQLPFLQTALDDFDIVPIVMGEESPEFCKELGAAIGEIMFNRKTLVVASVDVLSSTQEELEKFQTLFESSNTRDLIPMLNRQDMALQGRGPLLVAMLAAQHRNARRFQVLELKQPENSNPGWIGAYISK